MEFYILFIIGAVIGCYLLSTLVSFIFLRRIKNTRKYYYSIPISWVISTVIAGYGLANGGAPQFLISAINYGIASIILLSIYIIIDFLSKAREVSK